jgi:cell division protein FtsZ
MTIVEAEQVAEIVQSRISSNARIIWGAKVDPELEGTIRVMIVITGVKSNQMFAKHEARRGKDIGVDLIK